jgi:hypothetical protein
MPLYTFENPLTGEIKDVVFKMKDEKKFFQDGVEWKRIFSIPNAAVDTKYDPSNPKEFVAKSRNKKGTLGNLYDEAAEASVAREKKFGKDPIKKKYYEDWSKRRAGRKHPEARANGYL